MKKEKTVPYTINSIAEQHALFGLPRPHHPLVSILSFEEMAGKQSREVSDFTGNFSMNFYTITLKKHCSCKVKYGHNYYDFDQGVMSFFAPGQMLTREAGDINPAQGWLLVIHPDFLRSFPLGKKIKEYGFFGYAANEALHLSEKEEHMLENIMQNIEQEQQANIDNYSQEVMIAHIELLLSYANRFYNRQFITRKQAGSDLLNRFEAVLQSYINGDKVSEQGLPTVQHIATQLNISPNYLSDMLKKTTGQSAQQHIHGVLIEKAKEILASSELSVSEIAYTLGFEYPQSFSKLFKQKTNLSPLQFRGSFN